MWNKIDVFINKLFFLDLKTEWYKRGFFDGYKQGMQNKEDLFKKARIKLKELQKKAKNKKKK